MASSSSAMNGGGYDVFLSFRGADTRTNFTGHLYTALRKEGVNAFMDKNLRRGDEISSTLFQVIEGSKMSIVIFSPNYAASNFCLDELVKIMECKAYRGQIVFPVFYNVDPFEVEKQTGHYGTALRGHEFDFMMNMEKVKRWRSALAEAADLSGWDLLHRDESEVIREIVQDVSRKLNLERSVSEAELKERRLNEEKQRALRKLEFLQSVQTDMTKLLTEQSQNRNNYNVADRRTPIQMMQDSMSEISKVYECYNSKLSSYNEMLLKDLLSAGTSTSSKKPDT